MQARSFAHHPSCRPPLFGLTFVPPDMPMGPWEIHTQWSEQELTALILAMRPSQEALQNLLHYADVFIRTRPASNPLRGASIPGYTPGQMFTASFVTADPTPGALTPPPAAPTPVSLMLLWTMRGTRRLRRHVPHSASCQKLLNFISLPSAWPSPGLDCGKFSLRGFDATWCSALCRSAPPHILSFFLSSNHLSNLFRMF
jgi:hypothetical protein